jgi:NhaA family Na+:H+ antiporter
LSALSLGLAIVALTLLAVLNRTGVTGRAAYVLTGIFLWICVLKSGVHATLAGVALAFAIPLRARDEHGESPLRHMEHVLHPWVGYAILPLFAFANAGVSLAGLSLSSLLEPLPLGIAAGLFIGKQVGVISATWLATRFKAAVLPGDVSWYHIYGMSLLTGIGFTMSLFIGTLAFEDSAFGTAVRIGVLGGSVLSAVMGYVVLRAAPRPLAAPAEAELQDKKGPVRRCL